MLAEPLKHRLGLKPSLRANGAAGNFKVKFGSHKMINWIRNNWPFALVSAALLAVVGFIAYLAIALFLTGGLLGG